MLSIQPPTSATSSPPSIPKFTPNILPCRSNGSGPVSASKRYWNVEKDEKGRKVAYFRGRKLLGREVRIHKNYRGVVVRQTEKVLPRSNQSSDSKPGWSGTRPPVNEEEEEDEEAEREEDEDVKVLEEVGTFDEVVVWGHEQVPAADDIFVKGIAEWIGFAEAIHGVGYENMPAQAKAEG